MTDHVVGEASAGGAKSLYTRQSSGLVREMSFWANVAMTMSFMSLPLLVLSATAAPSSFPGADPVWVHVFAAALSIFPTLLFAWYMSVMPRAGGDYVFISRTLHPWIGFAANFTFVSWVLVAAVYLGYLVAPLGLSSMFANMAAVNGSKTLARWSTDVTSANWGFATGVVTVVLTTLVLSLPLRHTLRVMKGVLLVSLFSVLAALALLLVNGRSDFKHAVTTLGGNYNQILASAHKEGYPGGASFSFTATLLALPIAFAAYGYAFLGAYTGSEVRSPRLSGRRAMFAALGLLALVGIPLMILSDRTFGVDFLGSSTYLSNAGSHAYPFGAPASFFFYVSMLTHSTVLIALINGSFIIALMALGPPSFIIAARSLFAWSFDRILPTKLSDVDERTHTPIYANLVIMVVMIGFLAYSAYWTPSLIGLLLTAGLGEILAFLVLAVAGIVFPFRRRDMYERSPMRKSFAGIPIVSIIAACSLAYWGFLAYVLATRDVLGANSRQGWIGIIVLAVVGVLVYPISYFVNRTRGVDLGLAFRELPPE